jgi:UDP-N-acetylmuramate dehydrogenase
MQVYTNFSLLRYNTFGLDVPAERFVSVATLDELREAARMPGPKRLLGGGSNVLLRGPVNGLVVHTALRGFERLGPGPEGSELVRAAAGEAWHALVQWSLENGLSGIENLSLIPGTVGAAPIQNIGAYGVELCEVFHELEALHLESGELRRFGPEECRFGYRDSIFKGSEKGQYAIFSVTLRLRTEPVLRLEYGDIRRKLQEMGVQDPSPKAVSEAVCRIRSGKLPDPAVLGNAGSFFKNPTVPTERFEKLLAKYPDMPGYPGPSGVKIPAGWLIEQSGWKGRRLGRAGCHQQQALVLVNLGGATGTEIEALALEICREVAHRYEIPLECEVNFW